MKKLISVILAVAMLLSVSIAPLAADKEYPQKFWDLPKDHWAFNEVAELVERGVIAGYDDGSFKPDNTVTRAEWAKIMVLAAGVQTTDNSVRFSDMGGHWANPYVNAASQYLASYADGSFRPDQAAVREDVTVSLVKLKGYDVNDVDYSYLNRFTDVNSISNDLKKYVAVAIENELISGFEDNTFRGQATLTRAEAATLLWRAFQYGSDNKVTMTATPTAATHIPQTYLPTTEPTTVPEGGSVSEPVRMQSPEPIAKPTAESTPEPTSTPTPASNPYYIDTVKRVDMLGDDDIYDLGERTYYSLSGNDIYYADKDTNIKKLDVYTGEEEILINVDDEIALLSEEAEASSDMENIYIDGAQIKQVYYDAERNRVILWLYFNKSRTDGFYTITGGGLEQIMKEADKMSRLCVSLPDNRIMSEYYIYDAETGSIISEPGLFHDRDGTRSYTCTYPNNIYYINNTLYYESNSAERRSETGSVVDFVKYDFVDSQVIIPKAELNWTSSFAVYGDFIYELDYYDKCINKYTLSGAEREGIEMNDIAVRDGIPDIKGQLMFTDDGDMLIFNGNTFRIIKKNG